MALIHVLLEVIDHATEVWFKSGVEGMGQYSEGVHDSHSHFKILVLELFEESVNDLRDQVMQLVDAASLSDQRWLMSQL